jgi:nickel/cobalt transporter (NicO) family protein
VTAPLHGRAAREAMRLAALVAGLLLAAGAIDAALAQANPFGGPRMPAPALPIGGILGWVLVKQAEFYHELSGLIRAAKTDGSAVKDSTTPRHQVSRLAMR